MRFKSLMRASAARKLSQANDMGQDRVVFNQLLGWDNTINDIVRAAAQLGKYHCYIHGMNIIRPNGMYFSYFMNLCSNYYKDLGYHFECIHYKDNAITCIKLEWGDN